VKSLVPLRTTVEAYDSRPRWTFLKSSRLPLEAVFIFFAAVTVVTISSHVSTKRYSLRVALKLPMMPGGEYKNEEYAYRFAVEWVEPRASPLNLSY
jgi:hypothetical protein